MVRPGRTLETVDNCKLIVSSLVDKKNRLGGLNWLKLKLTIKEENRIKIENKNSIIKEFQFKEKSAQL